MNRCEACGSREALHVQGTCAQCGHAVGTPIDTEVTL